MLTQTSADYKSQNLPAGQRPCNATLGLEMRVRVMYREGPKHPEGKVECEKSVPRIQLQ